MKPIAEPAVKRVVAFFDGRNLRKSSRSAFGHRDYENTHPLKLARMVCARKGWQLDTVNFYIGVPRKGRRVAGETSEDWDLRKDLWGTEGVNVFTRDLTCNNKEKGIDVRIALDIARDMQNDAFDIALIFSQDQDFQEVVKEVKSVAVNEGRWLKTASAYPLRQEDKNCRGIDGADFAVPLDRGTVARCLEAWIERPNPLDEVRARLHRFALRIPHFSVRGTSQWAFGTAASLYLAMLLGTFGYLTFTDIAHARDIRSQPTIASEAVMMKVPPNAGNAVLWPYYWSGTFAAEYAKIRAR